MRLTVTAELPAFFVNKALEEAVLHSIAEPDDVADAVLFLISDMAKQITGETLRVDAGQYI